MRILIVRFTAIGDIVLTSPVLQVLKDSFPEAELHYATAKHNAFLLEACPLVHQIHTWDKQAKGDLDRLIADLKAIRFDYVLDLHHNTRTYKLKAALKPTPSYSFKKLNIEKWLLVNFKWDRLPAVHIVDRYLETLKPLGIHNPKVSGLTYWGTSLLELPAVLQGLSYGVLVIGATHFTKQLPVSKCVELAETFLVRYKQHLVLLGGPTDAHRAREITQSVDSERVINLCGSLSFHEWAKVVAHAQVVFTNDTGLMHVAAAFKRPTVSIWGNTTPKLGMYPYKTEYVVWENSQIACRPCSKIGFERCPKGHFKCMEDLVLDWTQVDTWL